MRFELTIPCGMPHFKCGGINHYPTPPCTINVLFDLRSRKRTILPMHIQNKIQNALRSWLPLGIAITLMSGLIYIAVQQNYRQNANDPQTQIAREAATQIEKGAPPQAFVPQQKTEISTSLYPYIIVYDADNKVIAGSASLHGQPANPPAGVFEVAKKNGENRVTWQPEKGIRSAIVVVPFNGSSTGYVLSGRSLKETEARVGILTQHLSLGWLAAMVITFLATFILQKKEVLESRAS